MAEDVAEKIFEDFSQVHGLSLLLSLSLSLSLPLPLFLSFSLSLSLSLSPSPPPPPLSFSLSLYRLCQPFLYPLLSRAIHIHLFHPGLKSAAATAAADLGGPCGRAGAGGRVG